ncbi:MAG: hypothetical protein M3O29_05535 [Actinomycetota bacterium]|nr:hypothetical protein [Actinomycetota bacterium]
MKHRKTTLMLTVAVCVLAACGSQPAQSGSANSISSQSSSGLPSEGAATSNGPAAEADPLAGIWQSDPITAADVDHDLRREFSGSAVDGWERVSSCYPRAGQTWVQVLDFAGGELVISTAKDGGSAREGWTGTYMIQDADTYFAGGETGPLYIKVDYEIKGGRLFADLIKDDFPHPSQRLGDTMCQAVIYEITPFTRVG